MQESRFKVLVVDDEETILGLVRDVLADEFDVVTARDGIEAVQIAQTESPDLVLLDMIMPKMDGLATARELRRHAVTNSTPIMMLTALKESTNRMEAFRAGVDDFISKPFHPDELTIRVKAKIERFKSLTQSARKERFEVGNLSLDVSKHTVTIDQTPVHLTKIEFSILKELLAKEGELLSRKELAELLWRDKSEDDRLLDSHLTSLRKKIKDFNHRIVTIYGQGFAVREGL